MFKVPEKYRVKDGAFVSTSDIGCNGMFQIPFNKISDQKKSKKRFIVFTFIYSDPPLKEGDEVWEHVSVSLPFRTPNWDVMCKIKDMFWDADDTVMQLHVPPEDHINNHPYCLHLWRPKNQSIPRPPSIMVGIK